MRACTHSDGVTSGLLAGSAVIAVYFFVDLLRLDPFSTPVGLTHVLVGPSESLDLPVVSRALALLGFGTRLAFYTVLHFTVFALVGVCAAWCQSRVGLPAGPVSGALFGAVVCTAAFYGALNAAGADFLAHPGALGVVMVNALAGAVMGGYLQLARRSA